MHHHQKSRFLAFVLGLLILLLPCVVQSESLDSVTNQENQETLENPETMLNPEPMSQEQIDDLLGLDPYLGPTSWLGSKKDSSDITKKN